MSNLRPWEILGTLPKPSEFDPGEEDPLYFYNNFLHPLIPDTIKMMNTGLHIDHRAVESLRRTVEKVLAKVSKRLNRNALIKGYQEQRAVKLQKKHVEESTAKVRKKSHYVDEYNEKNIQHRTWVVNTFLKENGHKSYTVDKWTVKALKDVNIFLRESFIDNVIAKEVDTKNPKVLRGMDKLADYKLELWNRPRYDKANTAVTVPDFNPGSAIQKQELFKLLEVEPLALSDTTGEGSWGRDQIEALLETTKDEKLIDVLEAMVDHSYGGIINNTFLPAFDKFTVDGVLHGSIKLFGAKSCRPTSKSPNMLNMPSTGSIYAKPLKKCFIAPDGYVVYAIDFAALEDRVLANLSGDVNKIKIFTDNLDGHSVSAVFYEPDKAKGIVGEFTDPVKAAIELKKLVNSGDVGAGEFRQYHKGTTFKLSYGGYPDDDKGGIITQDIFDRYHNELYPGITDYRENYVLKSAKRNSYIHLGLGCRIYTSEPDDEIRTLHNATCQFWSILTQIAVNELNYRSEAKGIENDVRVHATIYDSVYIYVKKDAETIKWVNDNIVEIMQKDFMVDQVVPNDAVGEIGKNWAELSKVPQQATLEEIESILEKL